MMVSFEPAFLFLNSSFRSSFGLHSLFDRNSLWLSSLFLVLQESLLDTTLLLSSIDSSISPRRRRITTT